MKSLDMQIEEFKKTMTNAINNSELPICVVELILHSFNLEIAQAVKTNIENERIVEEQIEKTEQIKQNQAKEDKND